MSTEFSPDAIEELQRQLIFITIIKAYEAGFLLKCSVVVKREGLVGVKSLPNYSKADL